MFLNTPTSSTAAPQDLRDGRQVEAISYPEVTILFSGEPCISDSWNTLSHSRHLSLGALP